MRHIQDLDHIRQKVEGLADFLAALAPLAPGDCLVDASGAARLVTLADLAARLALGDARHSSCSDRDEEKWRRFSARSRSQPFESNRPFAARHSAASTNAVEDRTSCRNAASALDW